MLVLHEFLGQNKTVVMLQPLYSPVLAFADFLILPKLKIPMKAKRFATIEEIKAKLKHELLAIPNRTFQKRFEDWKKTLAYIHNWTLQSFSQDY